MSIIKLFTLFALLSSAFSHYLNKFDYIIAGGGTAGSLLAGRLSEDPSIRVLLIERGIDHINDPVTIVPTVNSVISPIPLELFPVEHFTGSEPIKSSGIGTTLVPFALGGGPAVSGSFWGRGDPAIFDEWADLVGDSSLNSTNVVEFFKQIENVSFAQSSSPDRGRDGPIGITILDPNDTDVNQFVPAFESAFNVTYGIDYDTSAGQKGIWPMQRSLKREAGCNVTSGPCTRQSSYDGYIRPFLETRNNLVVLENAVALNLLWKPNQNKVSGVKIYYDKQIYNIRAKKEVILSMGSFGNPKFLQLAGIGDQTLLQEKEIPVIKHLPGVGKNLQDHLQFIFTYFVAGSPISVPSSVRIGYTNSGFNGDNIDVEVAWGLLPSGSPYGNILLAILNQVRNATDGVINVASKIPFQEVEHTFNLDAAKYDPIIYGFQKVREWMTAAGGSELSPGFAAFPFNSSFEDTRSFLQENVKTYYHPTGTCKMSDSSDPMGVVDSEYRVFGIENLRVCDASVFPIVIPTHPSGPTMMMTNRLAELLINQYN